MWISETVLVMPLLALLVYLAKTRVTLNAEAQVLVILGTPVCPFHRRAATARKGNDTARHSIAS